AEQAAVRLTPVAEVPIAAEVAVPPVREIALVDSTAFAALASPSAPEPAPETPSVLDPRPFADLGTPDEPDQVTCRTFPVEARRWQICDSNAEWETFARQMRINPEGFPESTALRDPESAMTLAQEICEYRERPGSLIKMRICDSAASWVALDQQFRSTRSLPANTQFIEGVPTHARHTPLAR